MGIDILYSLKFHICLCLVLLLTIKANGQDSNTSLEKRGLQVVFQNKHTSISNQEIASNILIIHNYSNVDISFSVEVSAPHNWKSVTKKNNSYTIRAKDSAFIPINLIPQKNGIGNVNHLISAILLNIEGAQFASAMWYVHVKKESKWTVNTTANKIFFPDNSDTANFSLKIQNSGNSTENLIFNFLTDKRLRILDPSNRNTALKYVNIKLPVNTDTTLRFTVKQVVPVTGSFRSDFETRALSLHSEALSIKIIANSDDNEYHTTGWRSSIDFINAHRESSYKEKPYTYLPLTIDASLDNLMSNSTALNVSMYGIADLQKYRLLNYRFQTFFIDNFYKLHPFLGYSHYVGYTSPGTTLEIGDISGSFGGLGFSASGKGIKGTQKILGINRIGGYYLNSPTLFSHNTRKDYGVYHEIRVGKNALQNMLQHEESSILNQIAQQYSNRISFNLLKHQYFTIGTSLSRETFKFGSQTSSNLGYSYLLNYSGSFKKLQLGSLAQYGSDYNLGARGISTYGANIGYQLKKHRSINASAYKNEQRPLYTSTNGVVLNSRSTSTDRFELRYNSHPLDYGLAIKLSHLNTETYNIRLQSDAISADYNPSPKGSLRFYLSLSAAYNELPDYNIEPYFTSQMRASLRGKNFSSMFRYNYGPFQAYEQFLFAKTNINTQSLFNNTNLRFWVKKDIISFEPSFTYSYETMFKRTRFNARPEIYFFPKSGIEFRAYGQYTNNLQRDNPFVSLQQTDMGYIMPTVSSSNLFLGLGIKKKLGIPISGKRFNKLTLAIFKDLNGNGKQDKNEPGIRNVLVNIKSVNSDSTSQYSDRLKEMGENFITDRSGQIVYKNLPKGIYKVSLIPMEETNGFFAGNDQEIKVEKDLTIAMPLNQGASLSGVLSVEKDPTVADLQKDINIGKIRVTAIDSAGKAYSTLTDNGGHFNFKLPVGVYQISINEAALPSNFEAESKRITVELLSTTDNYNITFIVREKKRKINIKKFDQQGKAIKSN